MYISVCYIRGVTLSQTMDMAFGNLHMTKSPTFFLSWVSPLHTVLPSTPSYPFCFPLFPTAHSHFPFKHAWGLTSHHTEKQLMLCSLSPPFLAKGRLM